MGKARAVKTLAGHFYEGIVSPAGWFSALNGLRELVEGGVFHHVAWDYRTEYVVGGLANDAQPLEKVREYELHHAANDPRIPIVMTMPVGGILLDHEHFSSRDISRNAIYSDWLAPLGYRHTLGVPVYDDGAVREWICVIRQVDQRPFNESTRGLLKALMPDLLRASRLRVHMKHVAARAAMGVAALDILPQALVLVNSQCAVQYLNAAAQRALALGGRRWGVRHGRLYAVEPSEQEWLARSVAAACDGTGVARAESRGVGTGVPIHVLPLQPTHPLAQWHHEQPYALLVWADALLQISQISAVLGLTEAEARLALLLAQGRTVQDFALAQGCSWHTARTHTRNLLRKTGTHRQAEIVALVRSLLHG